MLNNVSKPKLLIAFCLGILVAIVIVIILVRRQPGNSLSGQPSTTIIPTITGRPRAPIKSGSTGAQVSKENSGNARKNLSPEITSDLTKLRSSLPHTSDSFDMIYDVQLDRFIIQLKNNTTAKFDLSKYLANFGLQELYLNGSPLFYISSSPTATSVQTLRGEHYESGETGERLK